MSYSVKEKLENKLWHLRYKVSEFKYNLKESFLNKIGLRPTFIAVPHDTKIDLALHEWKEFSGAVTAFGDCDGFAKITTVFGGEFSVDLDEGWFHYPPNHYLLLDGEKVIDLWQERQDEKLGKEIAADDDNDNKVYWIVEARSTLVGLHSKLQVRHGFWTRVISTNLTNALNKTYELWRVEHNLSDAIQERKDSRRNYPKAFIDNLWRGEDPIKSQLDYETLKGDYLDRFVEKLDAEDWFHLWRLLKNKQESLTKFTDGVREHLSSLGVLNTFDQYLIETEKKRKEDRNERTDSDTGLITFRTESWEEMTSKWEQELNLQKQMIESVRDKFKRP